MGLNELSYSPQLIERIVGPYRHCSVDLLTDSTFVAVNMIKSYIKRHVREKVFYVAQHQENIQRLTENIEDEIVEAVIAEVNLMKLDNIL